MKCECGMIDMHRITVYCPVHNGSNINVITQKEISEIERKKVERQKIDEKYIINR